MNRPLGIGDFLIELKEAAFKGDTPGHPFRGNQYEDGGGSSGNELSGSTISKKVLFESPKSYDGKKTIKVAIGTHIDEGGSINGISHEHQDSSLTIQETDRGSKAFNVIHAHYEGVGKGTNLVKDIIHRNLPLKDAKARAQDWLERKDMEHRSSQ